MRPKKILVISGHIGAGKTVLATGLESEFDFAIVKTRQVVARQASFSQTSETRVSLQQLGDKLDYETNARWVCDGLERAVYERPEQERFVVDSARLIKQVDAIRRVYGQNVVHVHLKASDPEREKRFNDRRNAGHDMDRDLAYADVLQNETERSVDNLAEGADLVIDTDNTNAADTLIRVAARLGMYAQPGARCVDVLVGGQYGSEGKGQIAAYLADNYDYVLRVGGPNAGHKVKNAGGVFTYHHLPSGCRDNDATILLGAGMVINPQGLLAEVDSCSLDHARLKIDPQAMLIDESDVGYEKQNLVGAIASTGSGTGSATARKILGRGTETKLARDDSRLSRYIEKTHDVLERAYAAGKNVLLEGTQGSSLSLHHGEYPYVTSRETNVAGCLAEAGISPARVRRIVVVIRTYPIRVGNPDNAGQTSGLLKKELNLNEIARRSGLDIDTLAKTERTSTTNRPRRIGEFDWEKFRHACALNAPTDIALTFSDYISIENQRAHRFEQLTQSTLNFVEELERVAHAPVSLISTSFGPRAIIDRRDWS